MSTTKSQGRWTKEEHARYLKAVDMYGTDYELLESYIKTRTKTQIRTHHKAFSKAAASPAEKSKSLKSFKEAVSASKTTSGSKRKSAASPKSPKKSKKEKSPSKSSKKPATSSKKKKKGEVQSVAKEGIQTLLAGVSGYLVVNFAKKVFTWGAE